jgi:hypothetical protein
MSRTNAIVHKLRNEFPVKSGDTASHGYRMAGRFRGGALLGGSDTTPDRSGGLYQNQRAIAAGQHLFVERQVRHDPFQLCVLF